MTKRKCKTPSESRERLPPIVVTHKPPSLTPELEGPGFPWLDRRRQLTCELSQIPRVMRSMDGRSRLIFLKGLNCKRRSTSMLKPKLSLNARYRIIGHIQDMMFILNTCPTIRWDIDVNG